MPGALSVDLRARVVAAWEAGEVTQQQVADRFGVGVASVKRWVRLKRETGSLAAKKGPGRVPTLGSPERETLSAIVEEQPDRTREEIADELEARGGPRISVATVGRELRRIGLTRKKNAVRRGARS